MTVSQAPGGTVHTNVIVVPFSVPHMDVFPKLLLFTYTFTPSTPHGLGTASVAPVMVPVTMSPAWTAQCVGL
jgi:hypothetical protein